MCSERSQTSGDISSEFLILWYHNSGQPDFQMTGPVWVKYISWFLPRFWKCSSTFLDFGHYLEKCDNIATFLFIYLFFFFFLFLFIFFFFFLILPISGKRWNVSIRIRKHTEGQIISQRTNNLSFGTCQVTICWKKQTETIRMVIFKVPWLFWCW